MPSKVKKTLWWLLAAFFIYSIFRSPDLVSEILRTTWDIITRAFTSLGDLFDGLLKRKE